MEVKTVDQTEVSIEKEETQWKGRKGGKEREAINQTSGEVREEESKEQRAESNKIYAKSAMMRAEPLSINPSSLSSIIHGIQAGRRLPSPVSS